MVPLGYPWALPGPPGASRRLPGPKTSQSRKPKNLKELTERWSSGYFLFLFLVELSARASAQL